MDYSDSDCQSCAFHTEQRWGGSYRVCAHIGQHCGRLVISSLYDIPVDGIGSGKLCFSCLAIIFAKYDPEVRVGTRNSGTNAQGYTDSVQVNCVAIIQRTDIHCRNRVGIHKYKPCNGNCWLQCQGGGVVCRSRSRGLRWTVCWRSRGCICRRLGWRFRRRHGRALTW